MAKLLVPRQQYLASGVHIGMKRKVKDMNDFIFKIRPDGLVILNVKKINERIKVAAQFLARKEKILVAARKPIAKRAVKLFGEIIGAKVVTGRFMPGMLTNPEFHDFYEPDVLLVVDPDSDKRAVEEAVKAQVPIVAICTSGNETKYIDLVIPGNNKSKKSIAFILWLLAREILKIRGKISSDEEYKYTAEDFMGIES